MINNTKSLIDFLTKNYINKEINVAVDMTLGNGNDAKFILQQLKPKKLYGFDIQETAIINSKKKLDIFSNYELILDSHSNFDKYIFENIDFAIYNLGYLPNGNKTITTNYVEVVESIEKLLQKINENGKIIITFYPGHTNGKIESIEVINYLENLNQKQYSVIKFDFINQKNNPPFVVMITKIGEL